MRNRVSLAPAALRCGLFCGAISVLAVIPVVAGACWIRREALNLPLLASSATLNGLAWGLYGASLMLAFLFLERLCASD